MEKELEVSFLGAQDSKNLDVDLMGPDLRFAEIQLVELASVSISYPSGPHRHHSGLARAAF